MSSRISGTICKKLVTRSKNKGVNQEHKPVDQIVMHERLDEHTAAYDREILPRLGFEARQSRWHSHLKQD